MLALINFCCRLSEMMALRSATLSKLLSLVYSTGFGYQMYHVQISSMKLKILLEMKDLS
jgi:hypothetical protein